MDSWPAVESNAASDEAGGVGDVDVTWSDGDWVGGRIIGRTCSWGLNIEKNGRNNGGEEYPSYSRTLNAHLGSI